MSGTGRREHRPGKSRGATIVDVARRAGVSTATVSRAIAAPERVAEETRAAVFTAIAATGYTPNVSARNLRARSTRMVLALVPGMSNTFFTPILNALEDTLSAAGYGMIIGDTDNSTAKEAHYVRLIRGGQVDGVILFTGHLPNDGHHTIGPDQIPIALVCNEIPDNDTVSVFDVANRRAAQAAVEHLVACGHRRIAHIAGEARNVEARERLAGYREALQAAGIAIDETLVWPGHFRFEAGVDAAARYLAMRKRPTAVFASSDAAAVGFIRALREVGISTPADVSVVGFDDLDYAILVDPPLTTLHQPRAALGHAAAADLLKRMARDAPDLPPTRARFDCTLVTRASVRTILPDGPATGTRKAKRAVSTPNSAG